MRQDVGVVRNLDDLRTAPLDAVGAGEAEVERLGTRPEHLGQQVEGRLPLRIAVLRGLHDPRVDAERDVVDEHPLTDLGEVDPALDRIIERIERAPHIVTIETEIERKVVAGAGRDAHQGHVGGHGDRGNQRLRTVASGHPDDIGPPGDGVPCQIEEVRAGFEHDRLDPPSAAFAGQVVYLGLAAAGAEIHDQRSLPGGADGRTRHVGLPGARAVATQGVARQRNRHHAQRHQRDVQAPMPVSGEEDRHESDQAGDGDGDPELAQQSSSSDRVPAGDHGDEHECEAGQEAPAVAPELPKGAAHEHAESRQGDDGSDSPSSLNSRRCGVHHARTYRSPIASITLRAAVRTRGSAVAPASTPAEGRERRPELSRDRRS